MNKSLREKAETMFYYLTKSAARHSFVEFLENCGCSDEEWQDIKKEITDKTGIKFTYL